MMMGGAVILACLFGAWHSFRRPAYGLVIYGVALALRYWFHDDQVDVLVGSLALYPQDLAALVIFGASALRLATKPAKLNDPVLIGILTYGVLLSLSFLAGFATYGLKTAGLDFRRFFTAFAPLLFGTVYMDLEEFRAALRKGMLVMFCFLGITAIIRWIGVLTGLYVDPLWDTSAAFGDRVPLRVLAPGPAMLLAQISLIWLATQKHVRMAGFGLFCVIILQHRSVWLATLAGGGCLLFFQVRGKHETSLSLRRLLLYFAWVIIAVVGLLQIDVIRASLASTVIEAMGTDSTFMWRVLSWVEILSPERMTTLNWIVGKPFGTAFTRLLNNHITDAMPHSHYVMTIIRTGLLGLGTWLFLWHKAARRPQARAVGAMLVLTQLMLGVAYPLDHEQGIVLAVALGVGAWIYGPAQHEQIQGELGKEEGT